MTLITCIIIGFILYPFQIVFAQSDDYSTIVQLKNGNTIIGKIVENIPDKYVKLKTQSGSDFTFSYDEIESIKKGGSYIFTRTPKELPQAKKGQRQKQIPEK